MKYHEERKVTWVWVLLLVNIVCVVLFLLMARFYSYHSSNENAGLMLSMLAICAGVIALLSALTFCFAGFGVDLDEERLTFGFRHWKKSILVSHIAAAKKEPSVGLRFGGFGWRIDLAGRFGYIVSDGDAVEITTKARRKYVFSCENPERLVAKLEKKTAEGAEQQ